MATENTGHPQITSAAQKLLEEKKRTRIVEALGHTWPLWIRQLLAGWTCEDVLLAFVRNRPEFAFLPPVVEATLGDGESVSVRFQAQDDVRNWVHSVGRCAPQAISHGIWVFLVRELNRVAEPDEWELRVSVAVYRNGKLMFDDCHTDEASSVSDFDAGDAEYFVAEFVELVKNA